MFGRVLLICVVSCQVVVLIFFGYKYLSEKLKENSIEVGQIWKYEHQDNNPFEPNFKVIKTIIGVSENHVQYIQRGDTSTDTKSWFIIECDCIENCD